MYKFKRKFAILIKIYNKKFKYYKKKFLFNIFIRVFKDLYFKVNIKLKKYYNAFSIIFIGETNKFVKKNFFFEKIIKIIKLNFKIKKR